MVFISPSYYSQRPCWISRSPLRGNVVDRSALFPVKIKVLNPRLGQDILAAGQFREDTAPWGLGRHRRNACDAEATQRHIPPLLPRES